MMSTIATTLEAEPTSRFTLLYGNRTSDSTMFLAELNQLSQTLDSQRTGAVEASALLAMQVGIVVRDRHPERFLDLHHALFTARHEEGRGDE